MSVRYLSYPEHFNEFASQRTQNTKKRAQMFNWCKFLDLAIRTFGGISGEFGRAMVRILARLRLAKIPMARPNEPDMPPQRTKKVRLDIYRSQIRPSEHDIVAISGQWLDIAVYQGSRHGFWLANCEFGYGNFLRIGKKWNKLQHSRGQPNCQ